MPDMYRCKNRGFAVASGQFAVILSSDISDGIDICLEHNTRLGTLWNAKRSLSTREDRSASHDYPFVELLQSCLSEPLKAIQADLLCWVIQVYGCETGDTRSDEKPASLGNQIVTPRR